MSIAKKFGKWKANFGGLISSRQVGLIALYSIIVVRARTCNAADQNRVIHHLGGLAC